MVRGDLGSRDATPVFVVGLPRSGSSLVEAILDAHPAAWGAGEDSPLASLMPRLLATLQSGAWMSPHTPVRCPLGRERPEPFAQCRGPRCAWSMRRAAWPPSPPDSACVAGLGVPRAPPFKDLTAANDCIKVQAFRELGDEYCRLLRQRLPGAKGDAIRVVDKMLFNSWCGRPAWAGASRGHACGCARGLGGARPSSAAGLAAQPAAAAPLLDSAPGLPLTDAGLWDSSP